MEQISFSSILYALWIAMRTWIYNRWHKAKIQHKLDQETLEETANQVESASTVDELVDNMHGIND